MMASNSHSFEFLVSARIIRLRLINLMIITTLNITKLIISGLDTRQQFVKPAAYGKSKEEFSTPRLPKERAAV
jgi:hypothetical protein